MNSATTLDQSTGTLSKPICEVLDLETTQTTTQQALPESTTTAILQFAFDTFTRNLTKDEQAATLDESYISLHFRVKNHPGCLDWSAIQKIHSRVFQKNKQSIHEKKIKKNWTDDETSLLLWITHVFSLRTETTPTEFLSSIWKEIAKLIPFKSEENCKLRWLYLKRNNLQGAPWTSEEDDALTIIIAKKGACSNKWNDIAKELYTLSLSSTFRKGKQCRERWNNHLDPDMKRGDWTNEEDIQLLQLSLHHGSKWSYIAKELKERTENAVKNRYKSLLRKSEKQKKKHKLSPALPTQEENTSNITQEITQTEYNIQKIIQEIQNKILARKESPDEPLSHDEDDEDNDIDIDNEEDDHDVPPPSLKHQKEDSNKIKRQQLNTPNNNNNNNSKMEVELEEKEEKNENDEENNHKETVKSNQEDFDEPSEDISSPKRIETILPALQQTSSTLSISNSPMKQTPETPEDVVPSKDISVVAAPPSEKPRKPRTPRTSTVHKQRKQLNIPKVQEILATPTATPLTASASTISTLGSCASSSAADTSTTTTTHVQTFSDMLLQSMFQYDSFHEYNSLLSSESAQKNNNNNTVLNSPIQQFISSALTASQSPSSLLIQSLSNLKINASADPTPVGTGLKKRRHSSFLQESTFLPSIEAISKQRKLTEIASASARQLNSKDSSQTPMASQQKKQQVIVLSMEKQGKSLHSHQHEEESDRVISEEEEEEQQQMSTLSDSLNKNESLRSFTTYLQSFNSSSSSLKSTATILDEEISTPRLESNSTQLPFSSFKPTNTQATTTMPSKYSLQYSGPLKSAFKQFPGSSLSPFNIPQKSSLDSSILSQELFSPPPLAEFDSTLKLAQLSPLQFQGFLGSMNFSNSQLTNRVTPFTQETTLNSGNRSMNLSTNANVHSFNIKASSSAN